MDLKSGKEFIYADVYCPLEPGKPARLRGTCLAHIHLARRRKSFSSDYGLR
jgi:hypothetical protein